MRRIDLDIPQRFDGLTVRDVLRAERERGGAGMSRRAMTHAKYLEDGILLDGQRVRTNHPVTAGQHLSVSVGDSDAAVDGSSVVAQDGPVDILYEDDDLLVVNKPAGLVMYPNPGHSCDTLGNYLMGYFARTERHCTLHPVQRLDKGTSGLVVFAINAHAQHGLQRALHSDAFCREYLAICVGVPGVAPGEQAAPGELAARSAHAAPGEPTPGELEALGARAASGEPAELGAQGAVGEWRTINLPLGLTGRHPNTYGVLPLSQGGKHAVTRYRVLQPVGPDSGLALLHLVLDTGRTHQIRIHLASIGHPLFGDGTYGTPSPLIARPALHSARAAFDHPVTGKHIEITAPLPDDMGKWATCPTDFLT